MVVKYQQWRRFPKTLFNPLLLVLFTSLLYVSRSAIIKWSMATYRVGMTKRDNFDSLDHQLVLKRWVGTMSSTRSLNQLAHSSIGQPAQFDRLARQLNFITLKQSGFISTVLLSSLNKSGLLFSLFNFVIVCVNWRIPILLCFVTF